MITARVTIPALSLSVLAPGTQLASAQSCGAWTQHLGPNADGEHNMLRGVKAFSHDDAWAVGDFQRMVGVRYEFYGLILRRDGAAWSIVPSPNPGKSFAGGTWVTLRDIDGAAPDDIWAVGQHEHPTDPGAETLTLHWDGAAWEVVPSPKTGPSSSGSVFWAVEAIASDAVWAVGAWSNENDTARRSPLAAHWDGSNWTILDVPLATPTGDQELRDVSAVSSDAVWAVGGWGIIESAPYVLRWDGSTWSFIEPQPDVSLYASLEEVEALADDDVWVSATRAATGEPVMLHWDGSGWAAFDPAGGGLAIAAVAPDDIWSIGALALSHWDGTEWSTVAEWDSTAEDARVFGALDAAGECVVFAAGFRAVGATGEYSTLQGFFDPPACPADFNGDGEVNTLDVIAYLNAFNAGDPAADINADGTVNSLDFIAFLNLFNAGC